MQRRPWKVWSHNNFRSYPGGRNGPEVQVCCCSYNRKHRDRAGAMPIAFIDSLRARAWDCAETLPEASRSRRAGTPACWAEVVTIASSERIGQLLERVAELARSRRWSEAVPRFLVVFMALDLFGCAGATSSSAAKQNPPPKRGHSSAGGALPFRASRNEAELTHQP
jgi:hypothetical protein